MDGLQRRPSGIFVVRLVVPQRLRHIVGKTELVASTGVRESALARVVGAELLAQWRRRLLDLDRLTNNMDLVQVTLGSPVLQEAGFLSLNDAERASGIEAEELLRKAVEMRLTLFYRAINRSGHLVPKNALEEEPDGGVIFPMPKQMPPVAEETRFSGVLRVAKIDTYAVASALLAGDSPEVVAFDILELPELFFVPAEVVQLGAAFIELSTVQVEKLRVTLAANVTPPQLAEARAAKTALHAVHSTKASKRVSDAVVAFVKDETTETLSEQRDRVRQDLMLFGDLLGDPQVGKVDRDMLRKYRDDFLPKVPANSHRILPERPEASMKEKIAAVASTDWPRLSNQGISRRMAALGRLFTWLVEEGWISINPAKNLASKGAAKKAVKAAEHEKRPAYGQDDLQLIFDAPWYKTGAGELTTAGTYREFNPSNYWLPVMALYTGCRLNELAQLMLDDIRQHPSGFWYLEVVDEGEEGVGKRRAKTQAGQRQVPIHSRLIELGLLKWRTRLQKAEHDRLFPELRWDARKGPSKDASRWFSRFLEKLGWVRDGTRTFHNFRHTVISHCMNDLGMSETIEMELFGHARRGGTGSKTYRKDQGVEKLAEWVEKINFVLPELAAFDLDAGEKALIHALRRKQGMSARR